MNEKKIPIKLESVSENIYGGFKLRLGSILLDFLIFIPLFAIMHYLHSLDKNFKIATSLFFFFFGLWYSIYLPKKYGGTPGKLILGIRILKINGEEIGWKESILRNLIETVLSIFGTVVMIACVLKADNEIYLSKTWVQKGAYITTFAPKLFNIHLWANSIWMYSELIILLLNKRKRALHDFIAGTVIVKTKYIELIRDTLNKDAN